MEEYVILYIHGLSSSGQSPTVQALREMQSFFKVVAPDLPVNPDEALKMLKKLSEEVNPLYIIGTSMGAMFAQQLRGYKKILVNPAFHVSEFMRKNIGVQPFLNPRQDGAADYEITSELCDAYQQMESVQFEGITAADQSSTLAMFGTEDELVDCKQEYNQYYEHYVMFACGHHLTRDAIKNDLLPWIINRRFSDCKLYSLENNRIIKQRDELAEKTIFCLVKWKYTKLRNRKRDDYQRFKTEKESLCYFTTLEDAEAGLQEMLQWKDEVYDKNSGCYCYSIKELPCNIQIYNDDRDNYSLRIYNEKGKKIEERLFRSYLFARYTHSEFYGHPADKIRFKLGDVVEFHGYLGVVGGLPRVYNKSIPPHGDDSDDSYIVWYVDEDAEKIELDKDGYPILAHSHPMCTEMFEPHFPISPRIQRYIDNIRSCFDYPGNNDL